MGASAAPAWRRAGRVVGAVALIGYPALVWIGLTLWSSRALALVLLAVIVPAALVRLRGADAGPVRGLAVLPLVTVTALVLAAALDASGYVLAVPVAINGVLLVAFGATLRAGATPMIERFARLAEPELSAAQRAWCRLWTGIWCAFFVGNGATALALAVTAPLSWWALYNGLVAYGLMGALLATEWLLRRRRFGPSAAAERDRDGATEREPRPPVGGAGGEP